MDDGTLAFGPFVLDVPRGALLRDGIAVPLGQRAIAVLAALARSPGRTVAKEDLLASAWPGTIVEEGNLAVQIAAVRKALGRTGGAGEWIITVPRVGYRLVAPPAEAATIDHPGPPSLAVLPFDSGGEGSGLGALADGIVDDVITALGRFRTFIVAARNSTLVYRGRATDARQVAHELSVRYLVEGSVRQAGARLLAHAAGTIEQRIAMGWPPFGPDDRPRCRELARRGLLHAEGDAKVMAECGMALLQGAREYDWGLAVLESAVTTNPNDERVVVRAGVAHLHCGEIEQALAHFHRARSLSPGNYGSAAALTGIAHAHLVLGNHAEARDWAMRSLAVNPVYNPTYWMLVAANAHLGRLDEARRHLAEFRRLMPEVTVASIRAGQPARDPRRIAPILVGLRLAGLPEGDDEPTVPCLAVLPFTDLGGAGQAWFAEGVVDDIITALSRFRSFTVVARSSSFAYRGQADDPSRVARELGVRYLLEGSVRRSGDQLRISARLVAGETGAQLWATSFDGSVADVFDFQDRITEAVAMVVEPHIQAAEIEQSRRERPGSAASYDVYLRALSGIGSETEAGNAEAYALLREGLDRDPENPQLLALAAWALEHRCTMAWPPFGPDDRQRCAEFARFALERAGGDAMVLAHCGMSLLQGAREYDWGMAILEEAVAANPNNPMVLVRAAVGHMHCGDLEQTLTLVRRADRLSPGDPGAHFSLSIRADVALIQGKFAETVDLASRALARNPNFDPTLWLLIAANAHLGRLEEAKRYLSKLQSVVPTVTVARIRAGQPDKDPSRKAALFEGLRLAGMADS